ncbi:5'-3' exoribonuclease 2-like protein [Operophtera brumata]|uniref:5'-3' exoribonuclease 2-like protein n=1 Tax=Operophtera brumata TaxID=104452 RepID=A0A0L7KS40_OPEBR|nr:5'-3' exoribonuclease 2-like protein [Operophtera brumata]
MGVPAFFRWLSRKYPSVIVECVEQKPFDADGQLVHVDSSLPNPNNVEFDNLYLDMNGIIHPCTHPEDRPAPKDEDEMMVAIFECIDRLFRIVRPRKVLYMAIDGVRSRRFRASKETQEKIEEIARIRDDLKVKGAYLPPEKPKEAHFDSNCITPGTPFMDRLSKSQPDHDPNTQHVLCGADADLIMLGLATHEPNFTIIREEFKPNKPRPCDVCGQLGDHDGAGARRGRDLQAAPHQRAQLPRQEQGQAAPAETQLRTAREDTVCATGTLEVNLDRVQVIMTELGHVEDEIFKRRHTNELNFRAKNKARQRQQRPNFGLLERTQFAPQQDDSNSRGHKRTSTQAGLDEEEDEDKHDEVRLWEDGFKERYYESKFEVSKENMEFRYRVALQYVRGLCWVLRYYYQGCASWKWYFPYHYAPFASDFVNICGLSTKFEKGTLPLMGVFPAASSSHVPQPWAKLMSDPFSPIIDFYPIDFKIDLNGKKFAWQGVALLPFVDESRLFKALEPYYENLTTAESEQLASPVIGLQPVLGNQAVCARFVDPQYPDDFVFPARRLKGATEPPRVLKPGAFPDNEQRRNWRPQIGI